MDEFTRKDWVGIIIRLIIILLLLAYTAVVVILSRKTGDISAGGHSYVASVLWFILSLDLSTFISNLYTSKK